MLNFILNQQGKPLLLPCLLHMMIRMCLQCHPALTLMRRNPPRLMEKRKRKETLRCEVFAHALSILPFSLPYSLVEKSRKSSKFQNKPATRVTSWWGSGTVAELFLCVCCAAHLCSCASARCTVTSAFHSLSPLPPRPIPPFLSLSSLICSALLDAPHRRLISPAPGTSKMTRQEKYEQAARKRRGLSRQTALYGIARVWMH